MKTGLRMLKISLFFNLFPRFLGFLTASLSTRNASKSEISVLCLSRELFSKDISALREYGEFCYVSVFRGYNLFQRIWTSRESREQTLYQQRVKKLSRYQRRAQVIYSLSVISFACLHRNPYIVLSANIDYWQDRGFLVACKYLKIKFVALCKENPVVPNEIKKCHDWYHDLRYKFHGDLISVASTTARDAYRSFLPGFPAEKIVVSGLPRFDSWLDEKTLESRRSRTNIVTLISFSSIYEADDVFIELLHAWFSLSLQFPKYKFVVKSKSRKDSFQVAKAIGFKRGSNFSINSQVHLPSLLARSRVVAGYNSLALVDAFLARSSILIPKWGSCDRHNDDLMYTKDLISIYQNLSFPSSSLELFNQIASLLSSNDPPPPPPSLADVMNVVNKFIAFDPEISSTHVVEDLLFALVSSRL